MTDRPTEDLRHIADVLDAEGWPSVADDIREGVPVDTVLDRLREIGEGDSEAAAILVWGKA